jgi:hypothetical protein
MASVDKAYSSSSELFKTLKYTFMKGKVCDITLFQRKKCYTTGNPQKKLTKNKRSDLYDYFFIDLIVPAKIRDFSVIEATNQIILFVASITSRLLLIHLHIHLTHHCTLRIRYTHEVNPTRHASRFYPYRNGAIGYFLSVTDAASEVDYLQFSLAMQLI